MVAGAQEDTPEVVGRYCNMLRDTYSDTTNVEYTLSRSCTGPIKIVANGVWVGEPHLGAAGHHVCPKILGRCLNSLHDLH